MSLLRRLHNRSGTSLVEVLVTLVIFLIGMISVVRLFPGGFVSMKHSENVTLANRLAQTEIERWEARTANLPSGILAWGEISGDPGVYIALTDVDPANLEDPILPGGYYFSDVNKFRRINAESTEIPVPSPSNWNLGSVYVLGFSPIAWTSSSPNPNAVVVYGGEMRRRGLPRNLQNLQLKRYSEYAIDYKDALIYLRPFPNRDRQFIITYSYWQETGGEMVLNPAVGVSVRVPMPTDQQIDDGYQAIEIPAPGGDPVIAVSGFNGIDQGSDSLHREFDMVSRNAVWDAGDPYEFKVIRATAGIIAFNPLGYGYTEVTTRGKEPLTAYIDYTVLDWHIIHEERKLPDTFNSAADQDVKLTLRFIKKTGETREYDGSVYGGLAPAAPNNLGCDVMAVDVESGAVYYETWTDTNGNPAFLVNYREGIIRFDPSFIPVKQADPTARSAFEGKTFRIYYRAEGDYALQVFKAYDVFRRSYTPSLDHRQYYFAGGKIYFPRCYAGCTVAVDYRYRLNNETVDRLITGEAYQISNQTEVVGTTEYCYIDVLKKLQEVHGASATIDFQRIAKVYGVSLGTRVIWHETGRRLQAGAWRRIELQTYLTQVSG